MSGQKKLAYGTPKSKLGRKYKDVEAPHGGTGAGAASGDKTTPAPAASTHGWDCSCDGCEDARRIAIGLLPKDELRYPDFLPRSRRFFQTKPRRQITLEEAHAAVDRKLAMMTALRLEREEFVRKLKEAP